MNTVQCIYTDSTEATEEIDCGIKIMGNKINMLSFSDDIAILTENIQIEKFFFTNKLENIKKL